MLTFTGTNSSQAYVMRCQMFPDSERPESEEDTDEETKKSGKKKPIGVFFYQNDTGWESSNDRLLCQNARISRRE
jgi:hypothetical protein